MQCSVIIPVHNAEEYIVQTLDSLLPQVEKLNSQSHNGKSEIIVIDDKSTDSTSAIVSDKYGKNSSITLLNRTENAGEAFIPRLEAVRFAKTSNICFIDADDPVEPDYIFKMLKRKEETGADLVLPVMRRFSDDVNDSSLYVPAKDFDIDKCYDGKDLIKDTLIKWRISGNGGLYSKKLFLDSAASFSPSKGMIYNDEVFFRVLLNNARKIAFCNAVYYYRVNPESVTQKPTLRQFHILEKNRLLREYIRQFFSKDSIEWEKISIQSLHELIDCMGLYNSLDNGSSFKDEALNMIQKEREHLQPDYLRNKVSPVLLKIVTLGTNQSLKALKLYDRLRRTKTALKL